MKRPSRTPSEGFSAALFPCRPSSCWPIQSISVHSEPCYFSRPGRCGNTGRIPYVTHPSFFLFLSFPFPLKLSSSSSFFISFSFDLFFLHSPVYLRLTSTSISLYVVYRLSPITRFLFPSVALFMSHDRSIIHSQSYRYGSSNVNVQGV